jgi:hypothetical protein
MKPLLATACLVPTLALIGCESEPPIVGDVTQTSICNMAGLLIRNKLGKNVKTINQRCVVRKTGVDTFQIESGYLSPINPQPLRYTANGYVRGQTVGLKEIKIHSVDNEFIPFSSFPSG